MKTDKKYWRINQKANSKIQLKINDTNYFCTELEESQIRTVTGIQLIV